MSKERPSRMLAGLVPLLALAVVLAALLLPRSRGCRVTATTPHSEEREVPITAVIEVSFSQPVERSSVEASFRVEPEIDGLFEWADRGFAYRPRSALSPDTCYTVTLSANAVSERGVTLDSGYTWSFCTRSPLLFYLGRTAPGAQERQLYASSLGDLPPRQLTHHAFGVMDYTVHPEGEAVVYSVSREDGGSDLWRMDRDGDNQETLLACPGTACLNPSWSPDGHRIAYERRDLWADAPNLDPKAGRIFLLDLETNKDRALFDYDVPLHSPVWDPQGGRLAYVSPLIGGIEVHDLASGETRQFPNEWGQTPVWAPDGSRLIAADLLLIEEALAVRLVVFDLAAGKMLDISGDDLMVKDQAPAWSPGGGRIAFGRQYLDEERWTPGRQIWLVRPDGSEEYPLVSVPMNDLFGLAWRPDGAALAYLRHDLSEGPALIPDVSVWIFDLIARESLAVAGDGVLPKWVP